MTLADKVPQTYMKRKCTNPQGRSNRGGMTLADRV
jgi:hypothetical protein